MIDDTSKPAAAAPVKSEVAPAAQTTAAAPAAKRVTRPRAPRAGAPAKPAAKRPAARPRAKPAAKTAAPVAAAKKPAPAKTAPLMKKTAAKTTPVATKKTAASKPVKVKKPKLLRDSYTMPEGEYAEISALKKRCLKAGVSAKKSEILRAAIANLTKLSDSSLLAAIQRLAVIKTGRPAKGSK